MRTIYNSLCFLCVSVLLNTLVVKNIHGEPRLPDMGVDGSKVLTLPQEVAYSTYFIEQIYQHKKVIDDPVLTRYLDDLGQRLVNHTPSIKFPIRFLLIQDKSINAAAFIGGVVIVHTGLFEYAQTEDEIAAVLAHEISHVTQRHLARALEKEAQKTPFTIAGILGGLGLMLIDPQLGLATMSTAMGAHVQSAIYFTRDNEFEADRIGMDILYQAGFNPDAMGQFFQKLSMAYRYNDERPQMLLTHPVPETRLAEARNRARQYPKVKFNERLDFHLAKARMRALYLDQSQTQIKALFDHQLKSTHSQEKESARYGLAVLHYLQNDAKTAEKQLNALLKKRSDNLFYIDSTTDVDHKLQQFARAEKRLQQNMRTDPDSPVLIFNLANTYLVQNKFQKAQELLLPYMRQFPEQSLGWRLLMQVYQGQKDSLGFHQSAAELFLLEGRRDQAISALTQARKYAKNRLSIKRIDAQIHRVKTKKQRRKDGRFD